MNATCASCRAPVADMGQIGDVVSGVPQEPVEGGILVCGLCGGLNRFAADLTLAQAAIEDVIKANMQDAANVLEAQKVGRSRMHVLTFEPCNRKMCFNAAHWRLFLLLRPKGLDLVHAIRMGVGLNFCDAHTDENPDLYIAEEGWLQLVRAIEAAGKVKPHRASTKVQFLALESDEVLKFDKQVSKMKGQQVH